VSLHIESRRPNKGAIPIASGNSLSDCLCLITIPDFVPARLMKISHDPGLFGSIAGEYIPKGIEKKEISAGATGINNAAIALKVSQDAQIEIGPEPVFNSHPNILPSRLQKSGYEFSLRIRGKLNIRDRVVLLMEIP